MDGTQAQEFAQRLGIEDAADPVAVQPGLGGNELWRLRRDHHDDGDLVLRLFPVGAPDQLAERESASHALAMAEGVRTPRIVAEGRIEDRPALAMEWIDGPLVSDAIWTGTADPDRLGRRCGELLAALHRIGADQPAATAGAIGERDWIDWAGPKAAELRPLLQPFTDHRLLHLDFHPENLLLAGDDIVVLDWANARFGPAVADLARTGSIVELIRDGGHPRIGDAERTAVVDFGDGLLAGYATAAGEAAIPAAVLAWATAVQLVDLKADWVTLAFRERLQQRYRDRLPNRP